MDYFKLGQEVWVPNFYDNNIEIAFGTIIRLRLLNLHNPFAAENKNNIEISVRIDSDSKCRGEFLEFSKDQIFKSKNDCIDSLIKRLESMRS